MNLLKAEWNRLASRRFTKMTLLVLVGGLLLIAAGLFIGNQKISESDWAAARVRAAATTTEMRDSCQRGTPDSNGPGRNCDVIEPANPEWFLPSTFAFRENAEPLVAVFGGLMCLFAFLVGSSFIGAEWSSGGVANLLLWRPKRAPTLLGKYVALLTGLTGVFVAVGAVWTAILWLTARFRGNFDGVTSGYASSLGLTWLRMLALTLVIGTVAFAVASVGRRTAAALGAAIGVILVGEVGVRILFAGLFEVPQYERFVPSSYAGAWVLKKLEFADYTKCSGTADCMPQGWTLTMNDSAAVFGAVVVLALGAAFWSFTRRDVT
ncbi:ABC transporter permease subunit [Longispora sp. NPDC051575]|uniref:ABC transporter permease subunit n=1 Tax=Longispora sp. NPDC051575 TaxID=3154943 RepID=UPI00341528A2